MEMRDVEALSRTWRRYPPSPVGLHRVYRALLALSGSEAAIDVQPLSPGAPPAPVDESAVRAEFAGVPKVFGGG